MSDAANPPLKLRMYILVRAPSPGMLARTPMLSG